MQIVKILSDKRIRRLSSAGTDYYNALDLRAVLEACEHYAENEDVLLVPFYITSQNQCYEIYEYELNITVPGGSPFPDLSQIKNENRKKYCYINAGSEKMNILPVLKRYVDFILSLPDLPGFSNKLHSHLGELERDRLFFTVY